MQSSNNPPANPAPATTTTLVIDYITNLFTSNSSSSSTAPTQPPTEPTPQTSNKKMRRNKTEFEDNFTYSLSLPFEKSELPACPPSEAKSIYEYLSTSAYSVVGYFQKKPPQTSSIVTKQTQLNEKILREMIKLETPKKALIKQRNAILNKRKNKKKSDVDEDDEENANNTMPSKTLEALNDEIDDLCLKQVELVAAQIIEHAARRVELFFHLLVAVYYKNVTVLKDITDAQHGSGNEKAGTQACHSSMFPNVKFETKSETSSLLGTLFNNTTNALSLKGTHFKEVLNATVELPGTVNDFDGHLEGRSCLNIESLTKFTRLCLDIINEVSIGTYDPQHGINKFLHILSEFFTHFENKYITKKAGPNPKTMTRIHELEKMGTFFGISNDFTNVTNEFIWGHLRLGIHERNLASIGILPYTKYYMRLQNEIYSAKTIKGDAEERAMQKRNEALLRKQKAEEEKRKQEEAANSSKNRPTSK